MNMISYLFSKKKVIASRKKKYLIPIYFTETQIRFSDNSSFQKPLSWFKFCQNHCRMNYLLHSQLKSMNCFPFNSIKPFNYCLAIMFWQITSLPKIIWPISGSLFIDKVEPFSFIIFYAVKKLYVTWIFLFKNTNIFFTR